MNDDLPRSILGVEEGFMRCRMTRFDEGKSHCVLLLISTYYIIMTTHYSRVRRYSYTIFRFELSCAEHRINACSVDHMLPIRPTALTGRFEISQMRETRCMLDEPLASHRGNVGNFSTTCKRAEHLHSYQTYTVHISCSIVRLLPKLLRTRVRECPNTLSVRAVV